MISADSKHVPLSRRKSPESSRSRRGKRSECGHLSSFYVCCLLLKRQQTVSAGMCMQRGFTVLGLCVCLSVCLSVCSYSGYEAANEFPNYAILKKAIIFPEMTVFERYAMKSEKANKHNCSGLPQPDPLALCTLDAKEVTTHVYLLASVRLSTSY